jgi:hypothetical protein
MLLFGHRFIPSERFYHIDAVDAIARTPAGTPLYLPFAETNLDIMAHCRENALRFAVEAASLEEVIYAENLGAAYIVVEREIAKSAQKAADTYLFDAKILCRIDNDTLIEELAEEGVDGVLYDEAVIKVNS